MKTKDLLIIIFIFFTFFSCLKKKKTLELHTSFIDMEQVFKDVKAEELFEKANKSYELGEFEVAKNLLTKANKIEESAIIYNQLGVIETTLENYEKAVFLFKKGKSLDSKHWGNYINESRCYIKMKEYENAEKVLTNLILLTDSKYWKAYANFYLALRFFNDGNQCKKTLYYFELSKEIKNDVQLKYIYMKVENKIKEYCG